MALFHFHVDQIGRSAGRSAVACAAYRSGEKLYSEYYGETSDYTRKGGVMYSEIMLPPHAPMAYADRQTLWNAVEEVERRHDAQLAYSFDIALQNELTFEENLEVARAFLLQHFVGDGMTVDFCVHDPERDGIQNGGELDLPKTEENDMNDTTKQGTQGSSGMNPKKFPTSSLTADKTA